MKQTRALSQVFLKNTSYLDKIVQSFVFVAPTVLEIGAGAGSLSERLKEKTQHLSCVEIDRRFTKVLENKFKSAPNVTVIQSDILKLSLSRFGKKIAVIGNVPYLISNELIRYLVQNRKFIECAYLTLQKEFVDKLTATESMKAYGYLSCYIQYYASVEKLFDIPAHAFTPVPKVDSSFIRILFRTPGERTAHDENLLFMLIRQAFSQRRKKIVNSLPQFKKNQDPFKTLGISPGARAENISLAQYIALANALTSCVVT